MRNQPRIGCKSGQDNFWVDYEWISPSRFGRPSRPNYKPEFWDKIQELDQWTNKYDPVMTCQPLGLPRQGTPTRIIQTDKDIIFFYRQYAITVAETRNSATSPPMDARGTRRRRS